MGAYSTDIVIFDDANVGWRAEERPCPICGSRSARVLGARGGRAHRAGKGIETRVVRCVECHAVYQHPTLLPQSNPYETFPIEEYFQGHEAAEKIAIGGSWAALAESILGKPGKMLELGCGRGEYLRGAANRGWEARGIEMTENFARIGREHNGIDIESAPIQNATFLNGTYDVVLLAAVLEHIYDPAETLKRVHDALRPGGLVYIDVPNECSLTTRLGNAYQRMRGVDWAINLSPTFPPFHVVGFCPSSLRRVLELTGFRPLSMKLQRLLTPLPPAHGLRAALEGKAFNVVQTLGQLAGMGASMTCWATHE